MIIKMERMSSQLYFQSILGFSILALSLASSFLSCKSGEHDSQTAQKRNERQKAVAALDASVKNFHQEVIEQKYYENGDVKSVLLAINDSSYTEIYKQYHPNGRLELVTPFYRGNKHGIERAYSAVGDLQYEIPYTHGKRDGYAEWYYEDRTVASAIPFVDGMKQGEGFTFYPDGKVSAYIFYDNLGRVMYRVDYDNNGGIVKEKGTGFPYVLVNSDKLRVGQELKVKFHLIDPPHGEPELLIGSLDKAGNLVDPIAVELDRNEFLYKRSYVHPGKFQLGAVLQIDSDEEGARGEYYFNLDIVVAE